MPECNGCGQHLSAGYCKVFGNNENVVEQCHNCYDGARVDERAMAGLDPVAAGAGNFDQMFNSSEDDN